MKWLISLFGSIPKEDVEEPHSTSPDNDNESAADIKNPEDYREIFQAKPRLGMCFITCEQIRLKYMLIFVYMHAFNILIHVTVFAGYNLLK